ncbi:hypothetical protein A5626_01750 [Mycobacterium marseillense]|nr:hypothetical protein A5626_01750 [Mycobacterium marseillense]
MSLSAGVNAHSNFELDERIFDRAAFCGAGVLRLPLLIKPPAGAVAVVGVTTKLAMAVATSTHGHAPTFLMSAVACRYWKAAVTVDAVS